MPVRRITFNNGQQQSVTEVTQASRQNFPASVFELPAGYQKEALGGGTRPALAGQPTRHITTPTAAIDTSHSATNVRRPRSDM